MKFNEYSKNIPGIETRYLKKGWINKKFIVELDAVSLLTVREALKKESDRLFSVPTYDMESVDSQKRIIEAAKLSGMIQLIDAILPTADMGE